MYYAIERQKKGLFRWRTTKVLYVGTLENVFRVYNMAVIGNEPSNKRFRTTIVQHNIR